MYVQVDVPACAAYTDTDIDYGNARSLAQKPEVCLGMSARNPWSSCRYQGVMHDYSVRLLDLGEVPYLRSQTVYHAVAGAMGDDGPDTIILMSPREPYACIGYHQDLEQEIDLHYCTERHLPVLRREIGGGTVYLDCHQLFYHCVFHRRRAPRRVEDIYRLFLGGPIETYRRLGIRAQLCALNDIVVEDRKIGGSGAGTIGEAVVLCGSIIFDFDHETMAGLLRTPSPAFKRLVERGLRRNVTSIRGELGHDWPRADVRDILVAQFGETLGVDLIPGELSDKERAEVDRLDAVFLTDSWIHAVSRPILPARLIKIRAGVLICEAATHCDGSSARVALASVDGIIDDVEIVGDFGFGYSRLDGMERALIGRSLLQDGSVQGVNWPGVEIDGAGLAMVQDCLSSIEAVARKST